MKTNVSKELIEKYVAGTCTEEEKAIVEAWYLFQLKDNPDRPSDQAIADAQQQVWKAINPAPRRRFIYVRAIAAAAILLLVSAAGLFYLLDKKTPVEASSKDSIAQAAQVPEGTLLSASKIENSMMKLPDGSTVILEKGSSLNLLPDFDKAGKREVSLVGRAFFDIAHNPSRPFIIHAGTVKTTVLGTAFDVTAMEGSGSVKVNVIRGSVKVQDEGKGWVTILPKNFQAEFFEDRVPVRKAVDASKELSWNQDDLEFNDISIEDAQSRLEYQFGYKIRIDDPSLKKTTFSYSMRKKESAESFIKSICAFIGAEYTMDHHNKTITIKPLNQ